MTSRFSAFTSAFLCAIGLVVGRTVAAQNPTPTPASTLLWVARANTAPVQDNFGRSLAGGQINFDLNLDGSGDVVVGSPRDRDPLNPAGVPGSIALLDGHSGAEIPILDLSTNATAPSRLYGDTPDSLFGFALAENVGIGLHDLVVGAPGSAGGLPGYVRLMSLIPAGPYAFSLPLAFGQNGRVQGLNPNDQFGFTLAFGNFLSAPGIEIAVGAPQKIAAPTTATDNRSGYVQILDLAGTVLATVRGNGGGQPGDGFGYALKNVGDRNGDGWEELAVGAPFAGTSVGRVEVISFATTPGQSGTYSGVPLRLINGPAATSSTVGSRFGSALETLHTNLGTPLPELLLIGAPLGQTAQGPAQVGTVTAFALAGSAAPVWTVSDGLTLDKFGASISAAGDLNLDGAQDFLVGAPGADYGGNNEAGTVAIYQGNVSPSGVSLPPTLRFVADNASPDENLGISVHNLLRQSPNNGAILDTAVAGGPMIAGATPGFTRAYQNVARPSVQRQLGAGCPRAGSILDLELTITGATIGNTLTFQVRNAVPGQPVFLWGMYPPQSTYQLLLNGRGCFAYLDPTMVESSIVGVADAQGNFTHSQTIINSPMVIGATAHFQAFQVAPSPNGFSFHQVTSSNGVAVTAGGL